MGLTKAQMLLHLSRELSEIPILPIYILDSARYFANKREALRDICDFFLQRKTEFLAVRSSARSEDTASYSNAGRFQSVLSVPLTPDSLQKAIEKVYDSYQTDADEEILLQPMLQNVIKSGVVFTADMETRADYYTINYYEGSDTGAVTSGRTNDLRTCIVYHGYADRVEDADLRELLCCCGKIEEFTHNRALDIEFAVDDKKKVWILQVRPIACGRKKQYCALNLNESLKRISKKVEKLSRPHPFLLGKTTYFGVMPDWNPAEILGIRPKKLAVSLYKELFTDNIWAHQRANYGYRDLTMHPLMVSLGGIPYIDTRITFNSFIPSNLNEHISEKLVDYYLRQLGEYPIYHDKIEFKIVFSCYYPGIEKKLERLLEHGFNANECKRIEFALLNLTNQIIHPKTGLYKSDLKKANILNEKYDIIINSKISVIDKIYWLLEVCKEYGTLPFAGVARAAFIAVQLLNSLLEVGLISADQKTAYMNSLHTVNKELNEQFIKLKKGDLSKEEFLEKYGHIRPGTYDILSPRYDEDFTRYFDIDLQDNETGAADSEMGCVFSDNIIEKIDVRLKECGLEVSADELLQFIREAIEGREYVKFIFTKSVSKALQLIGELGQRVGIEKEELAHLDISMVKGLYTDLYMGDVADAFRDNIENNKRQYEYARRIKLPSIILDPMQIYQYYLLQEEPNFITQKEVTAGIVREVGVEDPEGKIVFIQSADPGFDYLFSKNIAGLVTQFGGSNSHMAIRCAELGIPAVIGAGESRYTDWLRADRLQINCEKRQVICL